MRLPHATTARIAAAQHGVLTLRQLHRAGLDERAVGRWVLGGRLHRVFPGVYALGHPGLSLQGHYLAAVLYAGPGAVLSHAPAAHLLRLTSARKPPAPEVVGPTSRKHLRVHRIPLHDLERTRLERIPITTVPRTLLDLAADACFADLARACHQAHVLHRVSAAAVEAVIDRAPTRKGAGRLRRIVKGDDPIVLSELERRFLGLLRTAGLPRPRTNRHAHGGYVDCRWPEHGLVVELVSYRFHATRHQFEADLRRERAARAAGDEHRRYGWADVTEQPAPVLAELRALLV